MRQALGTNNGNWVNAQSTKKGFATNRLANSMPSISDQAVFTSFKKLFQTMFVPTHGIFRGLATGLSQSALCYYKGSFDLNGFTGTNNTVTLCANPHAVKAPFASSGGMIAYKYSTGVTDPYATPSGGIDGPFVALDPADEVRVVSFTLTITPAGQLMNQGGEGVLAYTDNLDSIAWTRPGLDNLNFNKSFNGLRSMIAHWVPACGEEEDFQNGLATLDHSGLVLYITIPATITASPAFRVDWAVGIEYIPKALYKPIVDRRASDIEPNTFYFINKVLSNSWDKYMILDYEQYVTYLKTFEALRGGHTYNGWAPLSYTGEIGTGQNNPAIAEIEDDYEELRLERQMHVQNLTGGFASQ